jgi:hypothetical protein
LVFLRGALGDVGGLDALVDLRVFAVLVVVVLVGLVGVVGRVADHDADLAAVLALDAGDVFFAHAAKQLGRGARAAVCRPTLSSVSTKHRLGNSAYWPVMAA